MRCLQTPGPKKLPYLNVVTINELLSEPESFEIIVASYIDTIMDMAVWTHDVGAVIRHGQSPYAEDGPFELGP